MQMNVRMTSVGCLSRARCCLLMSLLVVVRISRLFMRGRRVLLERFHYHLDGFLELRIAPGAPQLRIHLDFNVRRDAMVLDVPRSIRTPERDTRRGDKSAIDQLGIIVYPNQSTPRAFSYQRSDS